MFPEDQRYLYRGVNEHLDAARHGRLEPGCPGKPFNSFALAGQPWVQCRDKSLDQCQCGDSGGNELVKHTSWKSDSTSGVSTSKSYDTAKHFATHEWNESKSGYIDSVGYVYVIDREKLAQYDVVSMVVKGSEHEEVTLIAVDNGEIPMSLVISKEIVFPAGASGS